MNMKNTMMFEQFVNESNKARNILVDLMDVILETPAFEECHEWEDSTNYRRQEYRRQECEECLNNKKTMDWEKIFSDAMKSKIILKNKRNYDDYNSGTPAHLIMDHNTVTAQDLEDFAYGYIFEYQGGRR